VIVLDVADGHTDGPTRHRLQWVGREKGFKPERAATHKTKRVRRRIRPTLVHSNTSSARARIVCGDRQAERLGGAKIDQQLESRRLLHGQITGAALPSRPGRCNQQPRGKGRQNWSNRRRDPQPRQNSRKGYIAGNTALTRLADSHLLSPIEPGDVAGAAFYFASDESRMVTGQVLPVDSGVTIS